MEYLLCVGLVIGLPVWFVLRSIGAANRQKALEQYAWGLQNWEYDDDGYHLIINFPSMRAQERRYTYDYPATDIRCEYEVRRDAQSCVWEIRHTAASHRGELTRLREEVRGLAGGVFRAELEKFEAGNVWQALADSFTAPLETAYQRYIARA